MKAAHLERRIDGMPQGFHAGAGGSATGRTLVVMLHGSGRGPDSLGDLIAAAREALAEPDLFVPALPYASSLSYASPTDITERLVRAVDAICGPAAGPGGGRYARVILVGHSLGALIVRRMYLIATGMDGPVPSEGELAGAGPRPWAALVDRIVTLAGLNRGWIQSGRLGWKVSAAAAAVAFMGHVSPTSSAPTLFQVRRGSPFIVHARLQWMKLIELRGSSTPTVVQLLGTQDDLVAPDDAIDFAVMEGGANYVYAELPQTTHGNACVFGPAAGDPTGAAGRERRRRFLIALVGDAEGLQGLHIERDFLQDSLPPPPDRDVKNVAFVVHGIRDDGYWTRKIAQRIRECADAPEERKAWRTITSSYGYFAMLPFVLPWIRREKVEWLMDEYVRVKAAYPEAELFYVGHSNGTYLLARALLSYPAARFRHVLFAGSVVCRDYGWGQLVAGGRVDRVLNMVATADWVVALFPTGLEPLRRWFDLGGAGFGGFHHPDDPGRIEQVRYVAGSHGAGLAEMQWPVIANFIVRGQSPPEGYPRQQAPACRLLARFSSLFLAFGVVLCLVVIPLSLVLPTWFDTPARAACSVAILAIYAALLRFVVTRV